MDIAKYSSSCVIRIEIVFSHFCIFCKIKLKFVSHDENFDSYELNFISL